VANSENSGGSLASSLTDLMTSLAVIFILLFVATLNNAQQETRQTVTSMLVAFQTLFQNYAVSGVEVTANPQDPLGLLILVPEGLLQFPVNEADVSEQGVGFLTEFAPQLAGAVCSQTFRDEIDSIVVEGHTDSSGTDTINLPLSQNRSLAVVREILLVLDEGDDAPSDGDDLRGCFLTLLSASGRGSAEPILDSSGNRDQARSRRVVFKIRVRSLEQRELRDVLAVGVGRSN